MTHDTHDPHGGLHELLDRAAPPQPDLHHAARMTQLTRRRRSVLIRLRVAIAGLLAAVGAAVAVPLLATGGSGGVASDPAPPDAVPVVEPAPCPAEPVDLDGLVPAALPDGAAWARACPAGTAEIPAGDLGLPTEPVVEQVGELVDTITALPEWTFPPSCAATMPIVAPFALVVGYPDGTTQTLGTTTRICASVTVDGTPRDVVAVLEAFESASRAEPAPADPGAPTAACPAEGSGGYAADLDTYTGALEEFHPRSGAVCYTPDPLGAVEYAEREGRIDQAGLNTVVGDLRMEVTPAATDEGMCTDTGPVRLLVLTDGEGRSVTLTDARCTGELEGAFGFYRPDDVAEAAIADALGGRVDG